jgi:hypothetical protein
MRGRGWQQARTAARVARASQTDTTTTLASRFWGLLGDLPTSFFLSLSSRTSYVIRERKFWRKNEKRQIFLGGGR